MTEDHVLLGAGYERGRTAGRAYAAGPPVKALREIQILPPPRVDEVLWALLVKSPHAEDWSALAGLREFADHAPGLTARAYHEGFNQGLRDELAARIAVRFVPPKRWAAVLRQSTRAELEAMLFVVDRCGSWTEFFTRSLEAARKLQAGGGAAA